MGNEYCYNCFALRAGAGPCPQCGYDPARDSHPNALPHGSVLGGRYITGRVLGQGGFGTTYVALDRPSGKKAAIKEYFPAAMACRMAGTTLVTAGAGEKGEAFRYGMERFLEEAEVLARFSGRSDIVSVRSFFQENGTAYFVMDYVEGISFKTYLRNRGGRVGWQEAVNILRPVMGALEAVHREGLVHRDVTPDNIYIAGNGAVKLLDFGAARYSLGDRSRSLDVVLKPGYAPKEQYMRRSRQGPFTDVYSLAACFYAAITGTLPQESLERVDRDQLAPFSRYGVRVPPALEAAICRGLAVNPEDRFQTMGEFRSAVERAAAPPPEQVAPPPAVRTGGAPPAPPDGRGPVRTQQQTRRPSPRRPSMAAVTGLLAAAGGTAALLLAAAGARAALGMGLLTLAAAISAVFLALQGRAERREALYREACAAYTAGDYQRAVPLFRRAAGAGDTRAEYCLGECFRWGNGVPQNMETAFRWYLAAAEGGNEDACYCVGCCYCAGEGVAVSTAEAVKWLEKAAASRSGAAGAARRLLQTLR